MLLTRHLDADGRQEFYARLHAPFVPSGDVELARLLGVA